MLFRSIRLIAGTLLETMGIRITIRPVGRIRMGIQGIPVIPVIMEIRMEILHTIMQITIMQTHITITIHTTTQIPTPIPITTGIPMAI